MKPQILVLLTIAACLLFHCKPKTFEPVYTVRFGLNSGITTRVYGDTLIIGSVGGFTAVELGSGRQLFQIQRPTDLLWSMSPERMNNRSLALIGERLYWMESHPANILIGRINQYSLPSDQLEIVGRNTFGNQIHSLPQGDHLLVSGYGRIYNVNLAKDEVVWHAYLMDERAYFSVAMNPAGLVVAAEGSDSLYFLRLETGEIRKAFVAPSEPRYGNPPFLFSMPDGDIIFGGESTLCRIDLTHEKTIWERSYLDGIQQVLLDSSGTGCVFERSGKLSVIGAGGEISNENDNYVCFKNDHRLPTWNTSHDTIALPSFCKEKTGISILQFPTLEEIAFHPCVIDEQFPPIMFRGLLVYVPDGKNEIVAMRIPR